MDVNFERQFCDSFRAFHGNIINTHGVTVYAKAAKTKISYAMVKQTNLIQKSNESHLIMKYAK